MPKIEVNLIPMLPTAIAIDEKRADVVFAACIERDGEDPNSEVFRISSDEVRKSLHIGNDIPLSLESTRYGDGQSVLAIGLGHVKSQIDFDYSQLPPTIFESAGSIRIVDANSLVQMAQVNTKWSVLDLAFSPCGTRLAAVGAAENGRLFVTLWSWPALEQINEYSCKGVAPQFPFRSPVQLLTFTDKDNYILVSTVASDYTDLPQPKSSGGKLLVFECKSGEMVGSIKVDHPCTFIDFNSQASLLACSCESYCSIANLRLSDFSTKESASRLLNNSYCALVFYSAEEAILGVKQVAGAMSRRSVDVDVLNCAHGEVYNNVWRTRHSLHDESLQHRNTCLSLSKDNKSFALGTDDGRVIVWSVD